jgi:hypothetical protein
VDSSNTSTVTTAAAHGLWVGARVTIIGATVDSDLNGEYKIATVPTSTTFTITTASVTDATYNEATLVMETYSPRTNARVWTIVKSTYVASQLTSQDYANQSSAPNFACDSRTTYF